MNRTIFYTLIAAALFIQMHNHYAAEVNQPSPNDVYTKSLIVRAKNGDSLELSPAELTALQSEYLKQLAVPEHGLSVESIAVLPISSVRPLQLLLSGSRLARAEYDDVVEATSLADLLMIPNGVDHFLKRLGRENIKLLCQLYQDLGLEGRELIKDYIIPHTPYKLTQRLGKDGNSNPDVDGHMGMVTSVALSPDGNTIISGSYDHTLIIWRRGEDGQFRFNPQRDRLGVVNNGSSDVGHTNMIRSIMLSPDGNMIISGSDDHTLIAWHRGGDGQFRFNPQRDRLGAIDNTSDHPDVGHTDWVTSIALSPDGNTIISGSYDHTLIAWHRGEDGRFRFDPQRDRLGAVDNTSDHPDVGDIDAVTSVMLSSDGNTIISSSTDHTVIVWHRGEDGQFRFDPQHDRLGAVKNRNTNIGHTGFVYSVMLSSDGNTIISSSSDHTAIIWHCGEDGQFRFNPQRDRLGVVNNRNPDVDGHMGLVTSVVLSPDGNTIISGSYDSTIIIWRKQSVDEFCVAQAQAGEVGI